jgi:hypothetical protein
MGSKRPARVSPFGLRSAELIEPSATHERLDMSAATLLSASFSRQADIEKQRMPLLGKVQMMQGFGAPGEIDEPTDDRSGLARTLGRSRAR